MRLSSRRVCSVGADLQPVLQQHDPRVDHGLLDRRGQLEEPLGLLRLAEAHHPLHAGAVVPAAVKDHDLAGGRKVREVPLDVHLRPLTLGRGGQGNDPEHARAHPLGDPLDRAPLPGGVPALEHDADLGPRRLDPLLHGHEFAVQAPHLPLVVLALYLRRRVGCGLPGHRRWRRRGLLLVSLVPFLGHLAHLSGDHGSAPTSALPVRPRMEAPAWVGILSRG